MLIRIANFSGIAPQADPHLLADNQAQVAVNCRFMGGVVNSFKALRVITTDPVPGRAKSIYRFAQAEPDEAKFWFTFSTDTDVAKSQIAADTSERTYCTNGTLPFKTDYTLAVGGSGSTYPHASYQTAIPAPTTTPVTTIHSGTGTGTAETRYYIYTYVSSWGEESLPSSASLPLDVLSGQTVRVSAMAPPTTGNYNITKIRIYRTATGANAADYQYVTEVPVATTIYDDSVIQSNLGEVCPSIDYDAPPNALQGLINLPNGIQAAFLGNDVYFSAPYRPFTFPSKYILALDYPIVGLGVFGTNLIAVTKGNPYVITGISPDAMSSQKMDLQQSCVSKRSIVSMGYGVVYASPDGLVLVSDTASLLTIKNYSKREWQEFNPETITACQYEGRYYAFKSTGGGIIVEPNDVAALITQHNLTVSAVFNDLQRDGLYLAGDGNISRWDDAVDGTYLSYQWKSKVFETPHQTNFAWGQVLVSDALPVTFKVYADHVLKFTKTVTNDTPFRLPSGFKAKYWEVEVTGTGAVRGILLANTIEELRNV
jgi:hypothetical protein